MLSGIWVEVVALVAAFATAVITTPAGVSGAVLLLPFQVSVLGTPSPSVTPTNLLYNVVASPRAIWRYRRQGQTGGTLTLVLVAGTLPGVVAGSVIRVYLLPGPVVFDFVVAAVLIPLGGFLALTQAAPASSAHPARLPPGGDRVHRRRGRLRRRHLRHRRRVDPGPCLDRGRAAAVPGCARGAQLHLPHLGRRGPHVLPVVGAPARSVAPNWPTGIALGADGLAGGYVGARLHPRLPETIIRRLLALIVVAIGIRYLVAGLTGGT